MTPGPEAVLARLLGLPGSHWWDDDDTCDAAVELHRLLDEEPERLAAALVAEVRQGRTEDVARLLDDVAYGRATPLVRAAAVDPVVARRWAARLLDLEGCISALGTSGAVAVLQDEFAGTGPDSGSWSAEARLDLWRQPPSRTWEFVFAADDRPVHASGDDPDLRSWLLGAAPEALFRVDPRGEPTPAELALLQAHVDGFVAQVLDALAAGTDPAPLVRWVNRALYSCIPSCCRPPRFWVAVSELGWFPA